MSSSRSVGPREDNFHRVFRGEGGLLPVPSSAGTEKKTKNEKIQREKKKKRNDDDDRRTRHVGERESSLAR